MIAYRNRHGRRALVAAGIAATLAAGLLRPANSQMAVQCVNCATIFQQLQDAFQRAQQLTTALNQLQTEINTYQTMLTSIASLPTNIWQSAQSDIQRIASIANTASLLSGSTGTMIANLQSANGYRFANLTNAPQQILAEQQAIGNSLSALGRVLNLQPAQLNSNAALIAALQNQLQSAAGQKAAIQAAGSIAATTGQQLISLQGTMVTAVTATGNIAAAEADRRAMEDAAMRAFSTFTPYPTTGYKSF
ncbi:MAG TPA: P-type conjugative transfer protein TrbJ [Stellaceae bacterium]|nr:P-type conjugative transfer protein TrbJ [Stellaceae bacterium]